MSFHARTAECPYACYTYMSFRPNIHEQHVHKYILHQPHHTAPLRKLDSHTSSPKVTGQMNNGSNNASPPYS